MHMLPFCARRDAACEVARLDRCKADGVILRIERRRNLCVVGKSCARGEPNARGPSDTFSDKKMLLVENPVRLGRIPHLR